MQTKKNLYFQDSFGILGILFVEYEKIIKERNAIMFCTYRKVLVVTCLVFCSLSSVYAYSGGSGTEAAPYQIGTVSDWNDLMSTTADWNKYFIMTADVDLQGVPLTPVGNGSNKFTGVLDGNGYIIRNADINSPAGNYIGLFGYLGSSGQIRNLGAEDVEITGCYYVGGLVGCNEGAITACYATGTVSGSGNNVGGLVGNNYDGSVSTCYATGAVSGSSLVGGLVGSNEGIITDCYSTGAITGGGSYDYGVGGLVGGNGGTIAACYATGTVTASGYFVGGLVGDNLSSIINNCYATSAVSGNDTVGGLVGHNSGGAITACYATGTVSGSGNNVGGLVGNNYDGSVSTCYATGAVSGSSLVGGLVGYNLVEYNSGGTITACYATGTVSGDSYVGGLVGYNDGGSISSCYFLITSGPNNGYGTPLTDGQMKQQSNFIGWDFTNETVNGTNNYWRMCVDGVDYPQLNWESISGDFACPNGVNVEDLSYLVERWLLINCTSSNNYCGGADINGSGVVNMFDFAAFADNWLEGI